jgi:DNA-binding NarL/FixJ family response regulator
MMSHRRSPNRSRQPLSNGHHRAPLTARERDIVRLVSTGLSNKLVALHLGLREGTVKIHLHNVYKKLRVTNRLSLIVREMAARDDEIRS